MRCGCEHGRVPALTPALCYTLVNFLVIKFFSAEPPWNLKNGSGQWHKRISHSQNTGRPALGTKLRRNWNWSIGEIKSTIVLAIISLIIIVCTFQMNEACKNARIYFFNLIWFNLIPRFQDAKKYRSQPYHSDSRGGEVAPRDRWRTGARRRQARVIRILRNRSEFRISEFDERWSNAYGLTTVESLLQFGTSVQSFPNEVDLLPQKKKNPFPFAPSKY